MNSPYVIAEMACAHDGSTENAWSIIKGASQAQADAIQFQIWQPTECVSPDHDDFELLKQIELGYDQWATLIRKTRDENRQIEIIACVYGVESARFAAEQGITTFKIHTSDLSNPVLLDECARLGSRIDLSVGGSYDEEIQSAVNCIRENRDCQIWLMYGIQLFPTPIEDINLQRMKHLAKKFDCPIGFQDHSDPESADAFAIPSAAVASGINIIEKHITHDRSKKGIDSQAALNPDEFIEFVRTMRNTAAFSRSQCGDLSDGEKKYRQYSKKQILASRLLEVGHILEPGDLLFSRPANWNDEGIQPSESNDVIGCTITQETRAFEPIRKSSLSQ